MNKFSNIEFFASPEGDILYKCENESVTELTESDTVLIDLLFDRIRTDYIEAFVSLSAEYGKSGMNIPFFKFLVVRRFIRCNMSNFDSLSFDFNRDGVFHFERVSCPMRGECKLYKIVCSPKFNDNLTKMESRILDLYCQPLEMDEIAKQLFLSPYTIDTHITNIRKKTGCHSKAELMKFNANRHK